MPFTPFHFGPGAALYALAPRQVSFLSFAAANVLIDFEPLYFMLRGEDPLHRFMHTIPGAVLATAATLLLFLAARRWAASLRLPDWFGWQTLRAMPVFAGAALGGFSHLLLDGIMHADLRPLAPWSEWNPFLTWVSIDALHQFCVISGLLGLAVLAVRRVVLARRGRR